MGLLCWARRGIIVNIGGAFDLPIPFLVSLGVGFVGLLVLLLSSIVRKLFCTWKKRRKESVEKGSEAVLYLKEQNETFNQSLGRSELELVSWCRSKANWDSFNPFSFRVEAAGNRRPELLGLIENACSNKRAWEAYEASLVNLPPLGERKRGRKKNRRGLRKTSFA